MFDPCKWVNSNCIISGIHQQNVVIQHFAFFKKIILSHHWGLFMKVLKHDKFAEKNQRPRE